MNNNRTFGTIVLTVIICLLSVSRGVCASGTEYTYDNLDRLIEIKRADEKIICHTVYDDDANAATIYKENNYATKYKYESFGDPDVKKAVNISTPNQGDPRADPYGNWDYRYTVLGNTEYTYNAKGNLIKVIISGEDIYANEHTAIHEYKYNSKQFLVAEIHPEMNTFSSSYGNVSISYIRDMAGNIISKTDARGTVGYAYDSLNRISTINYPGNTPDVSYIYDKDILRQMISTQSNGEALIAYTYGYWPDNKLYTRSYSIDGKNYQETFSYNDLRNIQTVTYPSSRVITYYYYGDSIRIDRVYDSVLGKDLVSNITYHPSSQISGYIYGDSTNIRTNIGYDRFQRPDMIKSGAASNIGAVTNLKYEYSFNNNISTITDNNNSDNTITLVHEGHDRLAYAYGPWGILMYGYDYLDNRIEMTRVSGQDVWGTTYRYENNRLISFKTVMINGEITVNIPYDASGNITKSRNNELIYDNANRITHVAGVQAYWYDGNGDRIIKKTGGKTTIYHYGLNGNVVSESSESGLDFIDYIYLGSKILVKCHKRGES
jgi:YD repeat-containing protein